MQKPKKTKCPALGRPTCETRTHTLYSQAKTESRRPIFYPAGGKPCGHDGRRVHKGEGEAVGGQADDHEGEPVVDGEVDQHVADADPRWVFKDYFSWHSDLRRRENWFLGLTLAWKPVFMPA